MDMQRVLAELDRLEGLFWEDTDRAERETSRLRESLSPLNYPDAHARLIGERFARLYRLFAGVPSCA